MEITITEDTIATFTDTMREDEKSDATIEKYASALRKLMLWLNGKCVTRQRLADYREHLLRSHCASTVNGALSAINTWLKYAGIEECRIRLLKVQRRAFCSAKKELSREEYSRLLRAAKQGGKERLYLIMETICDTGIRVSELQYITAEAAEKRPGRNCPQREKPDHPAPRKTVPQTEKSMPESKKSHPEQSFSAGKGRPCHGNRSGRR